MADERAVSAGQNRSEFGGTWKGNRVADQIDTSVLVVQRPVLQPPAHSLHARCLPRVAEES